MGQTVVAVGVTDDGCLQGANGDKAAKTVIPLKMSGVRGCKGNSWQD